MLLDIFYMQNHILCEDYILPCAFSQVGKTISNVVHLLKLQYMTRGRGQGNTTRASKTLIRGRGSTSRVNMPTSNAIGESASTQRNVIREATTSSQNNTISEGESNNNSGQKTLVFLSHFGLEPSNICSTRICESFKSELDPNEINWKSVSQEIRDFYLGEFKEAIRPKYVPEETWESWMRFWKDPKVIEPSKINSKNRCGGQNVVAKGTHTGGSITIGEHRKRLAIEKGRDPTPSELHFHVHTHGHDGKSFVGERAQNMHVYQATVEADGDKGMLEKVIKSFNLSIPPREIQNEDPKFEKYLEILHNQTQTQSNVDQLQAYYQVVGGEKKIRIYGLGAQDKSFYGTNLCASASRIDASSSVPCTNAQTIATENLDDFMTRLIPSLTGKMLPVLFERVRGLISSTSSQPNTHMTPVTSTPTNVDKAHAPVSDED
ncbi:hypothetical protein KY290_009307 [Solanum tuberosum]|uniref:Uncharacterized protein n=1 Tax=Solanum tuberosum TaxID=4113 RepID=A0ABQ7WAU5_SOLTU|nr:hypothetical protein KY290_009307 [Solanum tuberosum]